MVISKTGYQGIDRTVSISGDTVLNLTLLAGIRVSGTITEVGVGPLDDATVAVTSGPSTGQHTLTGHPNSGAYDLGYVVPGDFTVRASKAGYESVEHVVHAMTNVSNLNFTMKWAYGACLESVMPLSFDAYPSAGGNEEVTVSATAGRQWAVTPDSPWLQVLSPATQTGSGVVVFHALPNSAGATLPRRGALQIRCSASEGQNVWVNQNPACQVQLDSATDSPAVFGPGGGKGHLLLRVGTRSCRWQFTSHTDWIHTTGIIEWNGDLAAGVSFIVDRNDTGAQRTGTVVVGETLWQVTQQ